VPRPGEDAHGDVGAGQRLDAHPRVGERDQAVVGAVQPQQREVAEAAARGDAGEFGGEGPQRGAAERAVPDEAVGGVGGADPGVARQDGGVDGLVRDRVEREQPVDRAPSAQHRPRQHQPGELGPVLLRVAGGDQAAHGVAHHDERQRAVGRAGLHDDAVHVLDHPGEVLDQHPFARRAAVAAVVQAVDRGAPRAQPLGDVLVAADVLAVAVHEHGQPRGFGPGRGPGARRQPLRPVGAARKVPPPRRDHWGSSRFRRRAPAGTRPPG
jgi:hypothetical protein